jgi:hypothetical protein
LLLPRWPENLDHAGPGKIMIGTMIRFASDTSQITNTGTLLRSGSWSTGLLLVFALWLI